MIVPLAAPARNQGRAERPSRASVPIVTASGRQTTASTRRTTPRRTAAVVVKPIVRVIHAFEMEHNEKQD